MKSQIILEDIQFRAFHGVFPEENMIGNTFILSLILDVDLTRASVTDKLEHTVNYQLVYDVVKEEMQVQSNLIEHVAGRIIHSLMKKFETIDKIKIRLSKMHPPLGGEVKSATVVLTKER